MHRTSIVKYTKFSAEELRNTAEDPLSCVAVVQSNEILSLRPRDCEHIVKGVRRCVMDKIGRYHPKVNGIVLGYAKIRIENPLSAFRSDSPYLHVRATIDYYVFHPRLGSTLRGTVNYVSKTFVSAMIYKVFNVTVKLNGNANNYATVKKGSEISFIIKSCDMKSEIPTIFGELVLTDSDRTKTELPMKNGHASEDDEIQSTNKEHQLDTSINNAKVVKKQSKKKKSNLESQPLSTNEDISLSSDEQNKSAAVEKDQLIQSLLDDMLAEINAEPSVSKTEKKKLKKESKNSSMEQTPNGATLGHENAKSVQTPSHSNGTPTLSITNGSSKAKKRKIRFDPNDSIMYIKSEDPIETAKKKKNKV